MVAQRMVILGNPRDDAQIRFALEAVEENIMGENGRQLLT